jgi:hypothetical protein
MIRRVQTQRGVRYIDTERGNRFVNSRTGAREWVRQNIDSIRNNRTAGLRYQDLTTRERQSFSAQNRYRFNGQFLPNPFNVLQQFEPVTRGDRNLQNYFTREDIQRISTFTVPFQTRNDGRTGEGLRIRGELMDIAAEVNNYMRAGYDFTVITPEGNMMQGMQAIEYLRQWESQTIERFRNRGATEGRTLDRILINYNVNVNMTNNTIVIDLNEIDEDTDIDAYFDTP